MFSSNIKKIGCKPVLPRTSKMAAKMADMLRNGRGHNNNS